MWVSSWTTLEAAIAFLVDVGLEREEAGTVEREWVDKVVWLDGVRAEVAFVRTPDGNGKLELIKYHSPSDDAGAHPSAANRLGIRHVSFVVDDLCYVRGPEGIIVELAEQIGSDERSS